MKVLVVTNDFPPKVGGVNDYVAQITRRLPRGEVVVVSSAWPGAGTHDRAFPHPVVRWPTRLLLPTSAVTAEVESLARDERADVLLFGASTPLALIGPVVRRRVGIPYASFTHGLEIAAAKLPIGRFVLRHLARQALFLTTVSDWAAGRLRPAVGTDARLERLPPGIDAQIFRPDVSTAEVRARHALGSGPIITCVSRLVPRKGQDQLIRALPRIVREFPCAQLLIVGGGSYEGALRALARRARVDAHVVFTGQAAYGDLPAYFRVGDVFAMPCRSRYLGLETEALGAVYLQAAAVGRAAIGGRAGGAPEAVRDGETGLVVDGADVSAIEAALLNLLRNPEKAERMGATGAAWVHDELSWEAIAARLRALLATSIGDRA